MATTITIGGENNSSNLVLGSRYGSIGDSDISRVTYTDLFNRIQSGQEVFKLRVAPFNLPNICTLGVTDIETDPNPNSPKFLNFDANKLGDYEGQLLKAFIYGLKGQDGLDQAIAYNIGVQPLRFEGLENELYNFSLRGTTNTLYRQVNMNVDFGNTIIFDGQKLGGSSLHYNSNTPYDFRKDSWLNFISDLLAYRTTNASSLASDASKNLYYKITVCSADSTCFENIKRLMLDNNYTESQFNSIISDRSTTTICIQAVNDGEVMLMGSDATYLASKISVSNKIIFPVIDTLQAEPLAPYCKGGNPMFVKYINFVLNILAKADIDGLTQANINDELNKLATSQSLYKFYKSNVVCESFGLKIDMPFDIIRKFGNLREMWTLDNLGFEYPADLFKQTLIPDGIPA